MRSSGKSGCGGGYDPLRGLRRTGFAYRTGLSWWIFALAGGLALLIALLTVSFQSVKAALANPVKSLRSE